MMLRTLALHDFRNVSPERTFAFEQERIVFYGPNGRGKTNILEAISVMSTGKSWRETSTEDMISYGKESALIRATLDNKDQYQITLTPRSRTLLRNEKKVPLKKHLGQIPSLLFAPEQLTLFTGPKRDRQRYFDRFLCQISPNYRDSLAACKRATVQKNTLLREDRVDPAEIVPWNQILAEHIPQVIHTRQEFLTDLNSLLQKEYTLLAEKDEGLEVSLHVTEEYDPTPEGVAEFFRTTAPREQAAGRSLIGPQRDDFSFSLRGKPLTTTASRGEERSVLLALLSAKKHLLDAKHASGVILLLDDVFSELDTQRQTHLEKLCTGAQAFFTTTHEEHFAFFSHDLQKIPIA